VQALAGWFGAYDLAAHAAESPRGNAVNAYLRCAAQGCTTAEFAASSPIRHVDAGEPPTLLVHGLDDAQVMPSQSSRFAEALLDAGVDARAVTVPGVGHGLIGQDSGTTSQALRRALGETLAFLDQQLDLDAKP
jgi:dipeptidyl aminopeptidase/acylaminoacyl peptidase